MTASIGKKMPPDCQSRNFRTRGRLPSAARRLLATNQLIVTPTVDASQRIAVGNGLFFAVFFAGPTGVLPKSSVSSVRFLPTRERRKCFSSRNEIIARDRRSRGDRVGLAAPRA
ncbi:MAG TPA: hypothetical protein VHY91_01920 [Pirellulales bacterium]|nr:hypothetical protein [Pirellulales bacterium]